MHFLLNIKDVIEILPSIDYLMLKNISCHLSHIFLCQHCPFSTLSFRFIFLQQFIHTALGYLLKGFFCVSQNKQSSSRKVTYPNKISVHTFKSEFAVVTTRTWVYVCSLSCAQWLCCTHSSESLDLLWHSDPSLPCPVCPWAQMFYVWP